MSTRKRTLVWGWLLAVVAMLVFASAGRWQLGRMHEKQAMLAGAGKALDRSRVQPLLLASDPSRARAGSVAAASGSGDLALTVAATCSSMSCFSCCRPSCQWPSAENAAIASRAAIQPTTMVTPRLMPARRRGAILRRSHWPRRPSA